MDQGAGTTRKTGGRPTLADICLTILRTASITFGGATAITARLRQELMDRRGWLSEQEFELAVVLGRVTPGTNLIATCVALGWVLRGWSGALAVMLVASLPGAVVTVLLTLAYARWEAHPAGRAVVEGAMASVVGVIAAASWLLLAPYLSADRRVRSVAVVAVTAIASFWLSPTMVLLGALAAGLVWPGETDPAEGELE